MAPTNTSKKAKKPSGETQTEPPDMAELARRYLDLWQEEMSAMASDPMASDEFGRWFSSIGQQAMNPNAWLASINAMSASFTQTPATAAHNDEPHPSKTKAGAAPPGDASGGSTGDVAGLADRIAALERQLDDLAKPEPKGRVVQPRRKPRRPSA